MKYKIPEDLTSDVMFEAYGKDLKEVFENAGEALFSVICHISKVKPREKRVLEVKGRDASDLMHNWLQELIALVDTEEMFFSRFKIVSIDEKGLKSEIFGEKTRHELGDTVVKAVTYHKYRFEKTDKGYLVRAVLDI